MENQAERLTVIDVSKDIEECVKLDVRGFPQSFYQKSVLGEKSGG